MELDGSMSTEPGAGRRRASAGTHRSAGLGAPAEFFSASARSAANRLTSCSACRCAWFDGGDVGLAGEVYGMVMSGAAAAAALVKGAVTFGGGSILLTAMLCAAAALSCGASTFEMSTLRGRSRVCITPRPTAETHGRSQACEANRSWPGGGGEDGRWVGSSVVVVDPGVGKRGIGIEKWTD